LPSTTYGKKCKKNKGEVNTKEKYKQEKKAASYKKQKTASDKGNKDTDNIYSAKIYYFF